MPSTGTAGVDAVVERMRALDERLPRTDGVAVFNRVYLSVTEEIDRLHDENQRLRSGERQLLLTPILTDSEACATG